MKRVTSIWIEKSDAKFVKKCFDVGLRMIARETGISPSMMCRWLRGDTGMRKEKYDAVVGAMKFIRDRTMPEWKCEMLLNYFKSGEAR